MKILYNHRTQGRGAEGTHIMSIVDALELLGHEVVILSPPGVDPRLSHGKAPVDKSKVRVKGINRLWSIASKSLPNCLFEIIEIIYNVPLYFRMNKVLKAGKYDMIYERYAFYMLASSVLANKYSIPFILEANEVSGIESRARPQVFKALCARFERRLIKYTKIVLPVSSTLKNMLVKNGCSPHKIFIQPNAIEANDIVTDQNRISKLAAKFNLKGKVVIGCAGWFDKWDRLDFLLDVFLLLLERHPSSHLMIIGDGPAVQEIKKDPCFSKYMENITLTGAVPRSEMYTYLSLLDIAVLPHSNNFGSPVILFELMGLGRAIIAPALPPIDDIVHDQDIALTFEPLNQQDFMTKIELLITNPVERKILGEKAKQKVKEKHTWISNAENILKTID